MKWVAEQELGLVRRPTSTETMAELAARWQMAQLHHRDTTRATVQSALNQLILPALGSEPVATMNRQTMQAAVAAWMNAGYSPTRIRVAASYVSSMLSLAEEDGIIDRPVKGVRLPAVQKHRVRPFTVDQVEDITARLPERYRAMAIVAAGSGVRSGELRALTEDRVGGGVLVVDRQLVGNKLGRPVFGAPKSEASVRRIPIGASVQTALTEHLAVYGRGEGPVFRTRLGGPVSRTAAGDIWREATAGMDLPPRSGWHDLRHFHASLLIAAGLSVTAVAERLGHADPAETLRTYAHLWPTDGERATRAVEDVFGSSAVLGRASEGPGEPE